MVKETGITPMAIASAPITGRKVLVVATLLVISVKKIIMVATAKIRIIGWTNLRTVRPCPIHNPRPEFDTCAANDNPPPNSIKSDLPRCLPAGGAI